jgi:monoamine oxidase
MNLIPAGLLHDNAALVAAYWLQRTGYQVLLDLQLDQSGGRGAHGVASSCSSNYITNFYLPQLPLVINFYLS